jgi:N-acetylglucosaminyldiphosphoundecaprenol N-acetyl-beta-D-mannosaminyltransferase
VIGRINRARADLLLVGMGNPRQERWIAANRGRLGVGLAMGVGGLFHYWSGDLERAPMWIRRRGLEWMYILKQHPHKCRRYLLGNPKFLARMLMSAPLEYAGRTAQW